MSHRESSFHIQGKKIVTQPGKARHWRTARRAVSCSGLYTAWQYIPPHSKVSALRGMKDYWQNFSDLIAVGIKHVAERCCDFVAQERSEKINASFLQSEASLTWARVTGFDPWRWPKSNANQFYENMCRSCVGEYKIFQWSVVICSLGSSPSWNKDV